MSDLIKAFELSLDEKRRESESLKQQIKELNHRLGVLSIELNLLEKLLGKDREASTNVIIAGSIEKIPTAAEKYQDFPNISLKNAALNGIKILGMFSKYDLHHWIMDTYPNLGSSIKSLDKIIYDEIKTGAVTIYRANFGNKRPAIYKRVESGETKKISGADEVAGKLH